MPVHLHANASSSSSSMVLSSITVGNPRIWLLALKLKLVHHHRSFYVVDSSIRWTSCIRFLDEFFPDGSLALARASICTSVRSSICSTLRNGFLLHHAPRFAYSLSLLLLLLVYPPHSSCPSSIASSRSLYTYLRLSFALVSFAALLRRVLTSVQFVVFYAFGCY